jgi:hypothetical protein
MGLAIVRPRRDLDVMRAKNAGIEISFRRLENQFFSGSGTRHTRRGIRSKSVPRRSPPKPVSRKRDHQLQSR